VAVTGRDRRCGRRVVAVAAATEPIVARRRSLAEPSERVLMVSSSLVAAVAAAKSDDYKVGRPPRQSCSEAANICSAACCRPIVTILRPRLSVASDRRHRPRPHRHAQAGTQRL